MKNYGDPLSNCNDNIEDTRNTLVSNETPIPVMDTLPDTAPQVY